MFGKRLSSDPDLDDLNRHSELFGDGLVAADLFR